MSQLSSQIVTFYRGEATDAEGRRLDEILAWDDGELETVHDFIQWLFPLPEPSQYNADAPVLNAADVAAITSDPVACANLRRAFDRMLVFLGLACAADGTVVEGPHFAARARDVWAYPNHNWLRITRIIRSLVLLGQQPLATALYNQLAAMHASRKFPIDAATLRYWTDAVEGRLLGAS